MTSREIAPLLEWHAGGLVCSIAISHDGSRIASGSYHGSFSIWDLHTGAFLLGPLKGHTSLVRSVAWSHDDTRLVSGSWDCKIRIWDTGTGAPVGEPLVGHTSGVQSVAFSPDSTRIVSGSGDKTVRLWDACTGASMGEPLRGHVDTVSSVVFSPDATRIASGSLDETIRIWNAHTGAPMGAPLRGHTDYVLSVAFSRDSTRIVSGSADGTIRVWNAGTGALIDEPLKGHTHHVNLVAVSHDGTYIVSGSDDGTVRMWDALTGNPIRQPLQSQDGGITSVAITPDSSRIISSSESGTICVWEARYIPPSFDIVTSDMSSEEMFECLVQHGCPDVSSSIDRGRYSTEPIANGGFGEVWRVTISSGLALAVKTLRFRILLEGDDKAAKRAAREVHHWSKLRHKNVQELLGVAIFRGELGMVSPWLENGHLQRYLALKPEVPRYPLCVQLSEGVSYLHGIGMVHGDLKATNVLVSDDGILKINDFDYAVLTNSTLRFSTTTRPGGGTLRWMAPELLQSDEDHEGEDTALVATRNTETDVYALAMTMLEIHTGQVPYYEFKNDMGIYRAISIQRPPKRPKQLSGSDPQAERMWDLLLECWDHDPAARPDAESVSTRVKDIGRSIKFLELRTDHHEIHFHS